MSVKDVTKRFRIRPLAANPDTVGEGAELLDGNLNREDRRRSRLRGTSTRRGTDNAETVLVIAPKILGRGSQAPIHSSTNDRRPTAAELDHQSIDTMDDGGCEEHRDADTTYRFCHL